jgi:hypothetical protein
MAIANYPPMTPWLKELQKNDVTHNPQSEIRIPDQTLLPVVSLELLNKMNRKELTMGDERPCFPLIYEDVEGPMEPEQLVYLHMTDNNLEKWGLPQDSFALLNPNLPVENENFACVKWKGLWSFGRISFATDGHVELQYAPEKFLWLAVEDITQLELVAPMTYAMAWKPVRDVPKEENAQ